MLVQKHEEYTAKVLLGTSVSENDREQILIGAIANDLCEFTNEGYQIIKNRSGLFDFLDPTRYSFLYQSHCGQLTSLHAMSRTSGEPVENTMNDVHSWFEFLNDIATGKIITPNMNISADKQNSIYKLFSGLYVTYEDMFDSKDLSKIRYRAIGMMLHLIQDSFTQSHCKRDKDMKITMFYCYHDQDPQKHKKADDVSKLYKDKMKEACLICVEKIIVKKERYNSLSILELGVNSQKSSGGAYS